MTDQEEPKGAGRATDPILVALRTFVEDVYRSQRGMGMWAGTGPGTDYSKFFAELHSAVAKAYESYDVAESHTDVNWVNPIDGTEVAPGDGIPEGVPADLGRIVIAVIGFMRHLGIDAGAFIRDVVKIDMSFEGGDEEIAGARADEEEVADGDWTPTGDPTPSPVPGEPAAPETTSETSPDDPTAVGQS